MKKWEYKTVELIYDNWRRIRNAKYATWEDVLTQEGKQGWELVSVIHLNPNYTQVVAVLKREMGHP